MLKRAEGIVNLILCNPNKKEDGNDSKETVKPLEKGKVTLTKYIFHFSTIFYWVEKAPEPAPVPEVPKDPATTPIGVNKETLIELHAENKPLGIVVVKGDSSAVQVRSTHPIDYIDYKFHISLFF